MTSARVVIMSDLTGLADHQLAVLASTQCLPGVCALPLEWKQLHRDHCVCRNSVDLLVSIISALGLLPIRLGDSYNA